MLNLQLQQRLKDDITASMKFFRAPPDDVAINYDLAFDTPIDILIGPDVETQLTKDGNDLFDYEGTPYNGSGWSYEDLFAFAIDLEGAMEDYLWPESQAGVFLEADNIEHVLRPSAPDQIGDIYCSASMILEDLAAQAGLEARPHSFHPHMSFWQNGTSLIQQKGKLHLNRFFCAAVHGIKVFQQNYPALFIEPRRAENCAFNNVETRYNTPSSISFSDKVYGTASIRIKAHASSDTLTIEPRLSRKPPHEPIALYLHAVRYGLLNWRRHRLPKKESHCINGERKFYSN